MRILIADDERAIVDGIVTIIESMKWYDMDIVTAHDGKKALDQMKIHKPHVAILDVHMPKMTGLELAEEANKWKLCDNCIILTGYNDFEYAQRAIRSNVTDYLLKPVNKKYLLELIDRVAKSIGETKISDLDSRQEDIQYLQFQLENSGRSDTVNQIIQYINEHYKEDISLTHISEMMNKHPNYISNLFSKETNTSFIKYLQYIRLKEAIRRLIHEPHHSIKYIAERSGYQNPREFFKVFKKKTSYTPTQFRVKFVTKRDDES